MSRLEGRVLVLLVWLVVVVEAGVGIVDLVASPWVVAATVAIVVVDLVRHMLTVVGEGGRNCQFFDVEVVEDRIVAVVQHIGWKEAEAGYGILVAEVAVAAVAEYVEVAAVRTHISRCCVSLAHAGCSHQ